MESIDAAVSRIVESGLPVFFPDTCVLLDVIRATKRGLRDCVKSASELLQLQIDSPHRALIVKSSVVDHEWRQHAPEVLDEVRRHLREIEAQSSEFHDACQRLGIAIPFQRANYSSLGVAEALFGLSEQLMNAAHCLEPDGSSRDRAFDRVLTNSPPSKKGGEVKDCVIIEDYLEVARRTRNAGFRGKLVFCTSNTQDYCERHSILHANLVRDCSAVGLTFTSSLPWAVHELRLEKHG